MQSHPASAPIVFGQANAIVPDAQHAGAVGTVEGNIDPIGAAVGERVVHGFLCNPHQVRPGFSAKPGTIAFRGERTRDAVGNANIPRQGLEPDGETRAIQVGRAKATGKIARLADRLVQQLRDLVGRRRWSRLCC
jgi:hypothetical protein